MITLVGHEKYVRRPGIEPGSQEWESCMIPLHQRRRCNMCTKNTQSNHYIQILYTAQYSSLRIEFNIDNLIYVYRFKMKMSFDISASKTWPTEHENDEGWNT